MVELGSNTPSNEKIQSSPVSTNPRTSFESSLDWAEHELFESFYSPGWTLK